MNNNKRRLDEIASEKIFSTMQERAKQTKGFMVLELPIEGIHKITYNGETDRIGMIGDGIDISYDKAEFQEDPKAYLKKQTQDHKNLDKILSFICGIAQDRAYSSGQDAADLEKQYQFVDENLADTIKKVTLAISTPLTLIKYGRTPYQNYKKGIKKSEDRVKAGSAINEFLKYELEQIKSTEYEGKEKEECITSISDAIYTSKLMLASYNNELKSRIERTNILFSGRFSREAELEKR